MDRRGCTLVVQGDREALWRCGASEHSGVCDFFLHYPSPVLAGAQERKHEKSDLDHGVCTLSRFVGSVDIRTRDGTEKRSAEGGSERFSSRAVAMERYRAETGCNGRGFSRGQV